MSAIVIYFISTLMGVLCVVHGLSFNTQQPVLTIKTKKGQVFDCVDFYTQPSFKNSLLKNHVNEVNITSLQSQAKEPNNLGLDRGCPYGTVPILRTFNVSKSSTINNYIDEQHCVAAIRTTGYGGRKFYGAGSSMSLYKINVYGNQWSTSRMKLSNGPDSIEVGWMVSPALYNDLDAHLYAKFTAGPIECLDFQCPGFVQVNNNLPLGMRPNRYTSPGSSGIVFWNMSIDQSPNDGNWWLSMYTTKTPVGYWPKSLFTSLAIEATQVEWGGEISNPDSSQPKTFMGSGIIGSEYSTKKAARFFQVTVDRGALTPPEISTYDSDCEHYKVYDAGTQDYWERLFYYGGPIDNV